MKVCNSSEEEEFVKNWYDLVIAAVPEETNYWISLVE